MRIKHRFVFKSGNIEVTEFLSKHQIKYHFEADNAFAVFELFEDEEDYNDIIRFIESHCIFSNPPEVIYSQKEIDEAQWLSIRSTWRNCYPQPQKEMGYRVTTYDATDYCDKCGNGLVQKNNFMLQKEPSWGARNFLMINWIHDELFISQKAESVLADSNLTGFDIYDVYNKSGIVLDGVRQIYVKNYFDDGLMPDSIDRELHCEKCNNRIMRKPILYYDKETFKNVYCDIIKSKEKFGEITCSNIIFITQKFRQVITTNKLDRGLVFEPVQLI